MNGDTYLLGGIIFLLIGIAYIVTSYLKEWPPFDYYPDTTDVGVSLFILVLCTLIWPVSIILLLLGFVVVMFSVGLERLKEHLKERKYR